MDDSPSRGSIVDYVVITAMDEECRAVRESLNLEALIESTTESAALSTTAAP